MIFLGDIPPPLHGMSVINQQMLVRLRQQGILTFINTSPTWLANFFNFRVWLLIKTAFFFPVTFRLLWALLIRRERVLYRALNGGSGQVFDLFWLWLARLFGAKLFLHHHAALYLTSPSRLFTLVCRAAGGEACHIVLGEAMHEALLKNYGVSERRIRVLSNAAFFTADSAIYMPKEERGKLRIGYLANLSLPKGVDVFLETVKHLKRRGLDFEAVVAGPCPDYALGARLNEMCAEIPELQYVGGLYGEEKSRFFAQLDCFVYPSRNEAEPLVIYEAAVEGAYILSSEVGCMKASVRRLQGWSMPLASAATWANAASTHLVQSVSAMTSVARQNRKAVFHLFAAEARADLDRLAREIAHAET